MKEPLSFINGQEPKAVELPPSLFSGNAGATLFGKVVLAADWANHLARVLAELPMAAKNWLNIGAGRRNYFPN